MPSPVSSPARSFQLSVDGISCAACVSRVEKALLKVPGVHAASVNLASEQAFVEADASVTAAQLLAAVVAVAWLFLWLQAAMQAAMQQAIGF